MFAYACKIIYHKKQEMLKPLMGLLSNDGLRLVAQPVLEACPVSVDRISVTCQLTLLVPRVR